MRCREYIIIIITNKLVKHLNIRKPFDKITRTNSETIANALNFIFCQDLRCSNFKIAL